MSDFPKPPPLTEKQKDEILNALRESGKGVVEKLGDKMETAKRPFWRKLVRFFRGK